MSAGIQNQHMRKLFFITVIAVAILPGCSKKDYLNASDLDGRWTMIEVHNKATGETYGPRPAPKEKCISIFQETVFPGRQAEIVIRTEHSPWKRVTRSTL